MWLRCTNAAVSVYFIENECLLVDQFVAARFFGRMDCFQDAFLDPPLVQQSPSARLTAEQPATSLAYTHRVAISNHRILSVENGNVTFRWRDYKHGSKKRKMTIPACEFLRRFLLHVLPKSFVRIRHFGFLANR